MKRRTLACVSVISAAALAVGVFAYAQSTSTGPTSAPTTRGAATSRPNNNGFGRNFERRSPSTSSASSSTPTVSTTPPPYSRDFQLLQEKSIFSRNRFSSSSRERGSGGSSRVAQNFTFNGVVDVDGTAVAFIEDPSAGRVMRVKAGEAVGRAKVKRITLDSMDYELAGVTATINVGGQIPTGETVASYDSGSPAAGAASSSSPGSSGGSGNDVLERMRQARLKALGVAPPTPPSTPPPATAPSAPSPDSPTGDHFEPMGDPGFSVDVPPGGGVFILPGGLPPPP